MKRVLTDTTVQFELKGDAKFPQFYSKRVGNQSKATE